MDKPDDSDWVESVLGVVGTFLVVVAVVIYAQVNIPEPQVISLNQPSSGALGVSGFQPSVGGDSGAERDVRDEDLSLGGELYQMFCATCHAMPSQRTAVGFWLGSDLFDGKSDRDDSPAGLRQLIEEGILEEGMAPMKGVLSDRQIDSIVAWMLDQRQSIGI